MSIIFNNALYIHLPKTGGRFIQTFCEDNLKCNEVNCPYGHMTVKELHKHIDKTIVPFTFVRHPVDYIYSWWGFIDTGTYKSFNKRIKNHPDLEISKMFKLLSDSIFNNNLEAAVKVLTTKSIPIY